MRAVARERTPPPQSTQDLVFAVRGLGFCGKRAREAQAMLSSVRLLAKLSLVPSCNGTPRWMADQIQLL